MRLSICIAPGHSLKNKDMEVLAKFYFGRKSRDNVEIIAVNNAYTKVPENIPCNVISCDYMWWSENYEEVRKRYPKRMITTSNIANSNYSDIIRFCPNSRKFNEANAACNMLNSGIMAVCFSVEILCSDVIVMIGYDGNAENGRVHFHDDHKFPLINPGETQMEKWIKAMSVYYDQIWEEVMLFNCSPGNSYGTNSKEIDFGVVLNQWFEELL